VTVTSPELAPAARVRSRGSFGAQGWTGLGLFAFVVAMAFIGPFVTPFNPLVSVGVPGAPPSGQFLLGTDTAGRDVLSQLLAGGRTVLLLTITSVVISYAVGILIGMLSGYRKSVLDSLLMRPMDLLITLPPILIVLLAIAGLGSSKPVLVGTVAVVQMPFIARVVRSATLQVAGRGFVEVAIARGEPLGWLFVREILPNILRPVVADFGLRFAYAVVLLASLNFLGLGLPPGTADWGLMVSSNREIISSNVWSVLAPAVMLALLTIGVNLMGDGIARIVGRER
jgi:peptide/nickel transport system permease protein